MQPARSHSPDVDRNRFPASDAEQPRVLVIDDEESMRYSLSRGLRREGFACDTAETGRAGVDRFMEGGIDAVLTDVRLPDLSGIDIVSVLGEINADVPVIVMTGYGTMETALEVMRRGAIDFVAKPLVVKDVVRTLQRAISERRTECENRRLRAVVERTMSPDKYAAVKLELDARDVRSSSAPDLMLDVQDARETERSFRASMPRTSGGQPWGLRDAVKLFERAYVKDLLVRVQGNVAAASRLAGISRPNFHKKLKALGVDPHRFKEAAKQGRLES